MKNPEKNKENLLKALKRHNGLVSPACSDARISRNQYYLYLKQDEEFKQAVDNINESVTDIVESKLLEKIQEGDTKCILFYMKYKGKKRGYTESVDITSNGETLNTITSININVVQPNNGIKP